MPRPGLHPGHHGNAVKGCACEACVRRRVKQRAYTKKWSHNHPEYHERRKELQRADHAKHRERRLESSRARLRKLRLERHYGMSPEEYDALSMRQGGRCAICGEVPTPWRGKLHALVVDHNHQTGTVRGLLCQRCNTRLLPLVERGLAEKAMRYLESCTS